MEWRGNRRCGSSDGQPGGKGAWTWKRGRSVDGEGGKVASQPVMLAKPGIRKVSGLVCLEKKDVGMEEVKMTDVLRPF